MPNIIFSPHALDQMKRRGISRKQVMKAVNNPESKERSYRGRELRKVTQNDKLLEVPIKEEGSNIIVITAYYLELK